LLLKEIIKQTKNERSRDDVEKLRKALDLIHNIADHINSSITHQEKRNKVLELQIAFGVTLADPARKFIREGSLSKVCRNGKKSKQEKYNICVLIYDNNVIHTIFCSFTTQSFILYYFLI